MKTKIAFCKKYANLSDSTLRTYIGWINRLCRFSGKKKSTEITVPDISDFRDSLRDLSARSHVVAYAAINTIYKKVLWKKMPEEFQENFDGVMSAKPKQPQCLPLPDTEILTKDEIQDWLDNVKHPMYHLCASMAYHTGAKLSEICIIPLKAVKSERLEIGNRSILIPETIIKKIRSQKRKAKKRGSLWLFPSRQSPKKHISISIVQKTLLVAKPENISSGSGVRAFRASYIIHQIREGVDPNWLSYSLGMSGPKSLIPYMKLDGHFL